MKSDALYIEHILEAVAKIRNYTAELSYEDFQQDTKLQDAVVRNLEIIGEASKRLSAEIKSTANLPWLEISAMRNKIVHDYFEVDLEIVWKTAKEDVGEIEKELKKETPLAPL